LIVPASVTLTFMSCSSFKSSETAGGPDASTSAGDGDGGMPGTPSPCGADHTFCSDFDDKGLTQWTYGPGIALDTTRAASRPNSAVVTCGRRDCSMTVDVPGAGPAVRVGFDIEVDDDAGSGETYPLTLTSGDPTLQVALVLHGHTLDAVICNNGGGCPSSSHASPNLSGTEFRHVDCEVRWGADAGMTVSVAGANVIAQFPLAEQVPGGLHVLVGCPFATCVAGSGFRIDNVVVDPL
jgi:hypothetical protein